VRMLKHSLIKWLFREELVNYLKFVVVASETKYGKVHNLLSEVVGNFFALENQVMVCKKHDNVVRDLIVKFQRGFHIQRNLVPQPFFPFKSLNLIPKTWIVLGSVFFVVEGLFLFGKYVLLPTNMHIMNGVALYFFGFLTKCVQQGCGEEMHDSWWTSMGLKKLALLINISQGGSNSRKAQQPQVHHKNTISLNFSHMFIEFSFEWNVR